MMRTREAKTGRDRRRNCNNNLGGEQRALRRNSCNKNRRSRGIRYAWFQETLRFRDHRG
ncbi:MAG: hypothetical protein N2C14_09350 [Planctomycetales bacterium]